MEQLGEMVTGVHSWSRQLEMGTTFMVPSECHIFWGWDWQLYCSFCCLPFLKGSLWTIFVPLVFPSQWEACEIAAVTPCSAAVTHASKGIVAACMMCKENNFIFQECYVQKQNFQQVFKALRGRDCLEKYGKNTGKILTSEAAS